MGCNPAPAIYYFHMFPHDTQPKVAQPKVAQPKVAQPKVNQHISQAQNPNPQKNISQNLQNTIDKEVAWE